MAKLRNLVMRGATKQVGGMVTYQRAGETIARELAADVKNPRTKKQMDQRTKLANLVNFYRANKGWMKMAFENKKGGQSDYNRLVSLNINNNLVALTKSEANAGACIVAPYQVSQGSLIPLVYEKGEAGVELGLGIAGSATAFTTIGQLSTALMEFGFEKGDQFSVIVMSNITLDVDLTPRCITKAFECIVDAASTELITDYFSEAFVTIVNQAGSEVKLVANAGDICGVAMIHSRTIAGKTLVSTQSVVLADEDLYTEYTSDTQKEDAIKSYGESTEVFLDSDVAHKA